MWTGASLPLSKTGFQSCLDLLGVRAAELWTVLAVETKGCGYLKNRRPQILFERHVFQKETSGRFDKAHPDISSRTPGGYAGGTLEYDRLEEALALNRTAALRSTSWGIGQVMGFNSKLAGFDDVEEMVRVMQDGEDAQLMAVARFLIAGKLHLVLRARDWPAFARQYNGPDFQKNQYDTRLAAAFAGFSTGLLPDLQARQVQMQLMYRGFDVGSIDGIVGKRTRSAIVAFRAANGLGPSDVIDDELIAKLSVPKKKKANR
jgi:hypothetical protein